MTVLRDLLLDKKVVSALATILFALANRLGLGLDMMTVDIVCGTIVTLILGLTVNERVKRRRNNQQK